MRAIESISTRLALTCWSPPGLLHCEEESMIRTRVNEPLMMDRVADTTSHRERGALDGAIV